MSNWLLDQDNRATDPYRQVAQFGMEDELEASVRTNLHASRPPVRYPDQFWDPSPERTTESGQAVAHFGDLTDRLVDFIAGSDAVVGCVAWLSDRRILGSLADVESAIVVQKEDFLRPDGGSRKSWGRDLRKQYANLRNSWMVGHLADVHPNDWEESGDPVRCVGNHNSDAPANPRMHHKFLVRVSETRSGEEGTYPFLKASAVWTGSFNFSWNAGRSFENAVEIRDSKIAAAYLSEFRRMYALSEPLNWSRGWSEPEYRIGT